MRITFDTQMKTVLASNSHTTYYVERFSIECRKTKAKVIVTLANHKGNLVSQLKLEASTCSRHEARENMCERVMIAFAFTSDWLRKMLGLF